MNLVDYIRELFKDKTKPNLMHISDWKMIFTLPPQIKLIKKGKKVEKIGSLVDVNDELQSLYNKFDFIVGVSNYWDKEDHLDYLVVFFGKKDEDPYPDPRGEDDEQGVD